MTDLHPALDDYRRLLRDAVARDLTRRAPRRRLHLAPVAAVVAAVIVVAVLTIGGGPAQTANAAILRATVAALTPPPGTILHEQATVTIPGSAPAPFELWAQANPPHAYRVIKWGHEGSFNGTSFSSYDASTNTIASGAPGPVAGSSHEPVDVAATLRALVQAGNAQVVGTTTIQGTPAYELSVSGSGDPWENGTAYVAQSDYRPLLIETTADNETIDFSTYEYLPATAANLALLDLVAQHPGANVVQGG
jgi:hypothetical protein